jgi:hypothetical protein
MAAVALTSGGMNHHSRFDQLVAATEELIHENERMRTKYTAFEAALQEVVDNQRPYGALRKATSEVTPSQCSI